MKVDWDQPWLAGYREAGERVETAWARGWPLHDALNIESAAPVHFVPQSELPEGLAYEQHIFDSGCCPTRDNAHDFFNGLCWMRFPRTKLRLNQLQAAQIAADGIQSVRGPVRDALTLFDENAALLSAPAPVWQALAARDWHRLFIDLRPLWAGASLMLFGHALLEKLQAPRKAHTAHVYLMQAEGDNTVELDAQVAASLDAGTLSAKPFLPLPVLGVPGWWPGNEDPSFYGDTTVFRPAPQ
ncbi:MAG: DUF3025 domain-containing protein [Comamonadaceae bacterium]|nr:MAG: DUF3025 domain-containing protein [Comamonadaceae bacterium]